MSGIDNILQRIRDEAEAKAKDILQQAQQQVQAIEQQSQRQVQELKDKILSKAKSDAAEQRRRIRMAAELQMRKDVLSAKQEMIEKAFKAALQRLEVMDAEQYRQYMRHLLLSSGVEGDEEIIISEKDADRITPQFIESVNNELKAQGKPGTMFLSAERRSMRGGFILRKGNIEVNSSIEALINMHRDELEPTVAGILFSEVS